MGLFLFKADQTSAIDIAVNAFKSQDKTDRPVYHKDIAQIIKQQIETNKG